MIAPIEYHAHRRSDWPLVAHAFVSAPQLISSEWPMERAVAPSPGASSSLVPGPAPV